MTTNLIFKNIKESEREENRNKRLDIKKQRDKMLLNKENQNKEFNNQNLLIYKEKQE